METKEESLYGAIQGCLFSGTVADALGLPFEGITAQRILKFNPLPLCQRFFIKGGMFSDDTEHTCLVAQSLIACSHEPTLFSKQFAWRLRWWLRGVPAGLGMATFC
jgi:ADP-ribosylglycohydrolase